MPVKPVKLGTAAALGGAHVATLYLDEVQGWDEPFKRSSDYPQTVGFALGLALEGLDVFTEGTPEEQASDALLCGSAPLFIRSIYEAARHYLGPMAKKAKKKRVRTKGGQWKLVQVGEGAEAEAPTPARVVWG